MTVTVQLHDFDRLEIGLDEFRLKNQAFVSDVLLELANLLLTLIIRRAPVRTGFYARSWRIINQGPFSITVGSSIDPQIFVMLEFSGARQHLELPRTRKALRIIVGGSEFFAKSVIHPGFPARPHVRPALTELARWTEGIIYHAMGRHFPIMMREAGTSAARQRGVTGRLPPRQVGRSKKDVTANIGRGTKGKIGAQLTSRKTGRKRIRVRGLRRVGTAETNKAGSKVGGLKSRAGEQSF